MCLTLEPGPFTGLLYYLFDDDHLHIFPTLFKLASAACVKASVYLVLLCVHLSQLNGKTVSHFGE